MLNFWLLSIKRHYLFVLIISLFTAACSHFQPPNNSKDTELAASGSIPARALVSEITLAADGNDTGTNTYDIIEKVFAVRSIESPDLYAINHQGEGRHILQATDKEVGHYFIFLSHRDLDRDRNKPHTDRQRNEIKAYKKSVDGLKAYKDEIMQYSWKFKVLPGMELSKNFSHFFQLKAVNDSNSFVNGNDHHPIITISGAESSRLGNVLQVRHNKGHDLNGKTTRSNYLFQDANAWQDIAGEWVEVTAEARFSEQGVLKLTMIRLRDNKVIIDLHEDNIDLWRGNDAGDFVRPKWGIYRSLRDKNSLRSEEERVYFADFSIKKFQSRSTSSH